MVEELQASIFSELRTSEGANRLQQRVCGPTVSLTFNFLVSVAIILVNKLVFFYGIYLFFPTHISYGLLFIDDFIWLVCSSKVLGKVGFNYPIFLTLIHYVLSWFLMVILHAFSLLPVSPPSKATPLSTLFALGLVMSLSTGLANISLKYNRYFLNHDCSS